MASPNGAKVIYCRPVGAFIFFHFQTNQGLTPLAIDVRRVAAPVFPSTYITLLRCWLQFEPNWFMLLDSTLATY